VLKNKLKLFFNPTFVAFLLRRWLNAPVIKMA